MPPSSPWHRLWLTFRWTGLAVAVLALAALAEANDLVLPDALRHEPTSLSSVLYEGHVTEIALSPPRAWHGAAYDPLRDRMVLWGSYGATSGVRVWTLGVGLGYWTAMPTTGGDPLLRREHSTSFDPAGNRMFVFGGWNGQAFLNDVWELTLEDSTWLQLAPSGPLPSARGDHAAVYDPVRNRLLVIGGYDRTLQDDVWALELDGAPTWSQLAIAGGPSPRHSHTAVYDPLRDRIIVFGGYSDGYLDDVWALSLAGTPQWNDITPASPGPAPRKDHIAAYDPLADRVVVGCGTNDSLLDDVWGLSLSGSPQWSELAAPGTGPAPRRDLAAAFDTHRQQLILHGGWHAGGYLRDEWTLNLAGPPTWGHTSSPEIPPERDRHLAFHDLASDRMIVLLGYGTYPTSYLSDVWEVSMTPPFSWTPIDAAGSAPPVGGAVGVHDVARDRIIVFGGTIATNQRTNQVWELKLSPSPVWSELFPAGPLPVARTRHAAILDEARDRMIVYGGWDSPPTTRMNDVWSFDLATDTWTELSPTGDAQLERTSHAAVHDPVRDRMLVFGGETLHVWGGSHGRKDLWALDLETIAWTELSPAGPLPDSVSRPTLVLDTSRDRLFVYGGTIDARKTNNMWTLGLDTPLQWNQVIPSGSVPPFTRGHTSIYDPLRDQMVSVDRTSHLVITSWGGVVETARPPSPTESWVSSSRPNPTPGPSTVRLSLASSADVESHVYDIGGRSIDRVIPGRLEAGVHDIHWSGRHSNGQPAKPGVYFMSVKAGTRTFTRRVVVVR